MKFSLTPPPGQSAFDQWRDAMKAVNRLPMGLPSEFRRKVWLSLADHYIRKLKIDWHKTVRLAFNERSNPDDDKLGMQIVKDLHRTGCSSFSGQDNEQDRAVLKRVLLAYARWNKRIGYCQGFNVIAALLLNVMERKEDDALKVMIYLIDHVLPESYFDNNLRALSVDMAVFRDLLKLTLPTLSKHLDHLQHAAQDVSTGACYEPPLTNVFTMQWFLTLFATCLPKEVVLRVWDAILLEGSEVLLRTALCLWGKLARRIMKVDSADEFYSLMGELSSDLMEGTVFSSDDMIKAIYAIAPFPFPQLTEQREKYTYNIRPFSNGPAPSGKASRMAKAVLYSDEDELDEDDMRAITALPGMTLVQGTKAKDTDISLMGPGAYGVESEPALGGRDSVYMERMSTDITALKMHYDKLRQRQRQAHVIIAAAASAKKAVQVKQKSQAAVLVPKIESPLAMNHLFVGKVQGGRNRLVTHGPRIASAMASDNTRLTKQLQALASAQAASHAKLSPIKHSPATVNRPAAKPVQVKQGEGVKSFGGQGFKSEDSCEHEEKMDVSAPICQSAVMPGSAVIPGNEDHSVFPEHDCSTMEGEKSEKEVCNNQAKSSSLENDCELFSDLPIISGVLSATMDDDNSSHSSGEEGDHQPTQAMTVLTFTTESGADHSNQVCQQECGSLKSKESDSGVNLSSSSPDASGEPSPEKKPQQPVFVQLLHEDSVSGDDVTGDTNRRVIGAEQMVGQGDSNSQLHGLGRSLSFSSGPASNLLTTNAILTPATTPTRGPSSPLSVGVTLQTSSPLQHPPLSSPSKTNRPFNPFPVKHVNTNRAKTGLKLGLYTPSTLEHIQGQLRGGMMGRKARNASS